MRCEWQCSRINLPAADDEDVTVRQRQGVVQPVDYLAPSACHCGSRVTTMFRRPLNGRNFDGMESQVRRPPMITGWPMVTRLK